MKTVRFLSLLLAILMLAACMASCAETVEPNDDVNQVTDEDGSVADTNPISEAEDVTTVEEIELDDNAPTDFKGAEFLFLTGSHNEESGWTTYDVWVEKSNTGEPVNDAIYARNLYVNETYNVIIDEQQSSGTVFDDAKKAVKAGDDYFGAIQTTFYNMTQLADLGYLVSFDNLTYTDLSKSWWDQNAVKSCSINNKSYFATGDITVMDNDATWVLYFNSAMIANTTTLVSPFELVENNEWTYDKFYEMMLDVAKPDSATSTYNPGTSTYGFATTRDSCQGFLSAGGIIFAEKDAEDKPYNSMKGQIERLDNVAKYAAKIMNCDECFNIYKDAKTGYDQPEHAQAIFQEGRALFYGEVLQCAERMRASSTDFGLVVWPKFDINQSRYYNFVHAHAGKAVAVLTTVENPDCSSVILEAMASKSKEILTPAYYDIALGAKYLRDETSRNMLDKITESSIYDLGYIYNWAEYSSNVITMIADNKVNIASASKKYEAKFDKAVDKTLKKYQ